ncbi:hypothetical protein NVV93_06120 [Pseudomonas sp. LS44]|uniref:hypothetical protein n=1 Tax=Pseudomonas sp. LS44 TaxID=1357074 RepID=UPI00215A5CF7|nr:hypothetical protein [Pseudomonas sp. LS44]UVE18962.1 hypothetical protein NVV93_06120 [Pseudomonas sp. LS44]
MKFKLPKWSFLRYLYASYLSLLLINIVTFNAISQSDSAFGGLLAGKLQVVGIFLVPLVLSIFISVFTMAAFAGINYSLCFSLPLALGIAFYSGALTTMPDRVMNGLGLGNYQASEIALDNDYCEKNPPAVLALTQACAIQNAHVIWSLGETLVLRLPGDKGMQVQIPFRHVKAIVRKQE